MSWIEHHKVSEDLASQAQIALSDGREEDALALYARAALAENKALADLDTSKTRTLGISAVSAASLYYKAAEFESAKKVAVRWLEFKSLPAFAKDQLRSLLQAIRSKRIRTPTETNIASDEVLDAVRESEVNSYYRRANSSLKTDWTDLDGSIGVYIHKESERTLQAYRSQPSLVAEHANQEQDTARGGYAHRQIVELVQNAADQLIENGGHISIRLTPTHLYVADDGSPIDEAGARALMFSYLSPKRDTAEIGRFGIGFKSVLGVTDNPGIFSRTGSFVFDRASAANRIRSVVPDAQDYPVLRVAEPVDPYDEAEIDRELVPLMSWAVNIVRLPLKSETYDKLADQVRNFRAEFLLFVPHVKRLDLAVTDDETPDRILELIEAGGRYNLKDRGNLSHWKIFHRIHALSPDAQRDRRTLDDAEQVKIRWAVPLDPRSRHHHFWAFFPTQTTSLISGIFCAPWKTNEDRQNLLSGEYNEDLIDATAMLVADSITHLYTSEDPARHLDVLGGRIDGNLNPHADHLVNTVYSILHNREIIPDLDGTLCTLGDVSIPPSALSEIDRELMVAIWELWAGYEHRPSNWLHQDAVTINRLARINRIRYGGRYRFTQTSSLGVSISQWLKALTDAGEINRNAIRASRTAIQIAALFPEDVRKRNDNDVGEIVLTADDGWATPGPETVYLNGDSGSGDSDCSLAKRVHPDIQSDQETLKSLIALGVVPITSENEFKSLASTLLSYYRIEGVEQDTQWKEFWNLARSIDEESVISILSDTESPHEIRVMTKSGRWREIHNVLLPGPIVPDDGSRDSGITVDLEFHEYDINLIRRFGVTDRPMTSYYGFGLDRHEHEIHYLQYCRYEYSRREDLRQNPHLHRLNFERPTRIGPLDAFTPQLSREGRCRFTDTLLYMDEIYQKWIMHHDAPRNNYPRVTFESLVISLLREYGCVRTPDGIYALSDGLGEEPENIAVQRWLLQHPKTRHIRKAFPDLKSNFDGLVEPVGEDEPTPLTDEWPGLNEFLAPEDRTMLVRCDRLVRVDGRDAPTDCVRIGDFVYLVRKADEDTGLELQIVLRELDLDIDPDHFKQILRRETSSDVRAERQKIREQSTDAERLLAAVGEEALRRHLPHGLVEILDQEPVPFTGIRVAEAAIATYHTGALREYRHYLDLLDPPKRWAGGHAAVDFVHQLGFGVEWAGRKEHKRPPYEDVTGPYQLPPPHPYQKIAIANVRTLLRAPTFGGENRGLLSLPTGSGKTRVAVEAIIDAIREDHFTGTVLWIADRDELCEQAVESWRQAWSAIGPEAERLRISRMWGGRRRPVATDGTHVVVATRQTVTARGISASDAGDPLTDVRLLVVDEAHGSIAPSYTSIMRDLGLTSRRREDEICLLGLTATPYRGRNEEETERLVNRYGRHRLDSGAFDSDDPEDVIRELQNMNVLADVDHQTIEGSTLRLDDLNDLDEHELRQLLDKIHPWLPDSVQQRIANNAERTRRIVDAYMSEIQNIDPTWPTLIFATSVEHAETIAAMLQLEGVEARAVSGKTDVATRRSVVEQFRAGAVKVLVNYGVFREGFDAPKTRAIIVARPVYSPNLYFQMIGRGLRGELNGGSDRCLILDVEDNIEDYDRALAFSELDWLWN